MIIGGKVFNPGELRTLVVLAPRSVSTETGGFLAPAPDLERAVTAWARWTNAHGSEVWAAGAAGANQAASLLIRHRAEIDATWFVSKDDGVSWYEVISLDNIGERGEYDELKVARTMSG